MKKKTLSALVLALSISSISGVGLASAMTDYKIQKGDTLYSISKNHQLTVNELKQLNHLTSNKIYAGKTLKINNVQTIVVKRGDTLYGLAMKHGMTINQIKTLNNFSTDIIRVGQKLLVVKQPVQPADTIKVKKGDTLYSLAQKHKTSVSNLKKINNLSSDRIKIGQTLKINSKPKQAVSGTELSFKLEKGFSYTPEEPGKHVLLYDYDDRYWVRVENLGSSADIQHLKKEAAQYLKETGKADEIKLTGGPAFYKGALFHLHVYNDEIQTKIVVKKINENMVRFTFHYPNEEQSEFVFPSILKILNTASFK